LTRGVGRRYEGERMRRLALVLAAVAGAAAAPAAAAVPSITLNGVNIDGVVDQRFENCTVVIDAKGDVHIEAKGYAVQSSEPPRAAAPATAVAPAAVALAAPPPTPAPEAAPQGARPPPPAGSAPVAVPAKVTRRYFLATEQSTPGGTQYDVAIFINAQWIRELKASDPQLVMEVTKYLKPGSNKVVLAASKRIEGARRSSDPAVTLKVVIGEGNVGGGHVMIDEPLVQMTRTAAETEDRTEEYVLEAR
jgi:hypothetical protein